MSGHSKWSNIKRKKEVTDGARAKIFTKIGREMTVCVKQGGGDPSSNTKLRDLIAKAKSNNVPNENIDRIIKKASGGDKDDYEAIVYEGYGPGGVAVIVEALTDNRNRTAGDVRHYFDKFGGNLGTAGCVGYMFQPTGLVVISSEKTLDEDTLMEVAFELGADDFSIEEEGDMAQVSCAPADLHNLREGLESKGYKVVSAEVEQIPSTTAALTDEEQIKKMTLLLEYLEDNDDVQQVFHNWENPAE